MDTQHARLRKMVRWAQPLRWLTGAIVTGLIVAGALGVSAQVPVRAAASTPGVTAAAPGHTAPALTLPSLAGGQLTLAQYAGHPRVLAFFAASCIDCRPDLTALERAYRRYQRDGLVVLGIGVGAAVGDARWMAQQVGATFPIGYDETGTVAARTYQLSGIPTTVFVNAAGTITGVVQGRITHAMLAQSLARILPAGIR